VCEHRVASLRRCYDHTMRGKHVLACAMRPKPIILWCPLPYQNSCTAAALSLAADALCPGLFQRMGLSERLWHVTCTCLAS
jgi:hypothetical protein